MSSQTQRAAADFFTNRVRDLAPSPTIAVSDRARQLKADGIDVIDLGGGDPDFITPEHIRAAATEAMNAGDTHYVASAGIPALRKAIADKLRTDNGIEVDATGGVIVTPGGKQALFEATLAFVEPGVDVMIPEPAWVSYGPMVELAGGTAVPVPLDPDDNWRLTGEILAAAWTPASRILLINSPNNPTGRVLGRCGAVGHCRVCPGTRSPGLLRRDVRENPLRRTATHQHRDAARHGRADARFQRPLQGLCHDGLAFGIRGGSTAVPRADRKGAQPLCDLCDLVRAEGRRRRTHRTLRSSLARWSRHGIGGAEIWPNG